MSIPLPSAAFPHVIISLLNIVIYQDNVYTMVMASAYSPYPVVTYVRIIFGLKGHGQGVFNMLGRCLHRSPQVIDMNPVPWSRQSHDQDRMASLGDYYHS